MSKVPSRHLVLALCLPLLVAGCSSSGSRPTSAVSPSASSASPSSSAKPRPATTALPVASAYVVTARAGVTYQDLKDAITPISKIPGVTGVSLLGKHTLRVDLDLTKIVAARPAVLAALRKLGTVSVPT